MRKLATIYKCEDNALFAATLEQYILQQQVIDMIRGELDKDNLAVTKEYVKGRENVYANPLVKELPKHTDSANKTAMALLKIITTLGESKHEEADDEFEAFLAMRDR